MLRTSLPVIVVADRLWHDIALHARFFHGLLRRCLVGLLAPDRPTLGDQPPFRLARGHEENFQFPLAKAERKSGDLVEAVFRSLGHSISVGFPVRMKEAG